MTDFLEHLMRAKYHLQLAERMYNNYYNYETKPFLTGTIKELAHTTIEIILCTHIQKGTLQTKTHKNIALFKTLAEQEYGKKNTEELLKILEVARAQEQSPIEFTKKDTIILLIQNKYRFLKITRLQDFLTTIKKTLQILEQNTKEK